MKAQDGKDERLAKEPSCLATQGESSSRKIDNIMRLRFVTLMAMACRAGALATVALSGLTAAAAVIDVRSAAQATGGLIRLGDVASVLDADPETERQLSGVSLGPAPAPGRKTRITQQTIRERLLAHGMNLTEIEFTGQGVVLVETPAEPKTPSSPAAASSRASAAKPVAVRPFYVSPALRKKAEEVLQTAFHRQYHAATSDVGPLKLTVTIPDDDVPHLVRVEPHQVRFVETGLEWGGPQRLTAQVIEPEGATRVIRLEAWLNESPQILTVKHTVSKGQILQEGDVAVMPAKGTETGLTSHHEVIGLEATRDLHPGQPLQSRDVNKVPLVRTNDLVTVRVRMPGLVVSRIFRAQGSGAEGETVSLVALEDSRERVLARVTGWHEAEIETPGVGESTGGPQSAPREARRVPSPDDRRGGGGK